MIPQGPSSIVPTQTKTRCLIVAGDDAMRRAVARTLQLAGLETVEAGSGLQALAAAKQLPDLIALDTNLPDRDRVDIVRELRDDAATAAIPVVYLASAPLSEAERADRRDDAERIERDAESANRVKSEFLATMSHEIRTPINAILGYAQILDMGIAGPVSDDQRLQLSRLRRAAAHLLSLVDELLDLAKIDAGRMRVELRPFAIDDAVEDALAIARPLALARAIAIDFDATRTRGLSYIGDATRVQQILVNLLSNAIKFSEPASRITVEGGSANPPSDAEVDRSRHYVAMRVQDRGIGVNPHQLSQIFEPFVQGESGWTRPWGGTGLGLAISRRLARLMCGDITVSTAGGAGSVFTLWMPATVDQSLIRTTEQPVPRRPARAFDPTTLAVFGRILIMEVLTISHALDQRVRRDQRFGRTEGLAEGQLVDHLPALLAALGLALINISDVGVEASPLLQDGSAIRSEIADRHGAQRRRLGWTFDQVNREYDIVLEEIERVLRERAPSGSSLDGVMGLIARLLDQSRATSARGYREASGVED